MSLSSYQKPETICTSAADQKKIEFLILFLLSAGKVYSGSSGHRFLFVAALFAVGLYFLFDVVPNCMSNLAH